LTGDVGTLSTLPRLARLDLHGTGVAGNIGQLVGASLLSYLDLHGTKVSGGIGALSDQHPLAYIDLSATDVTGEVGALSPLPQLAHVDLHGTKVSGGVGALAVVSALAYLDMSGTAATGFPLTITDCCTFKDAAHPFCIGKPGADAACAAVVQAATALLAFKASGGAATATALASWQPGTDPCGVPKWAGVTCSGGAAPAVTGLDLYGGNSGKFAHVAGQIGTLVPLATDLTWLNLDGTDAAGDVAGLAPLVKLTFLSLEYTKVTGEAAALAPLSRLTYLSLYGTAVAGCDAFCGAGGPFHSHCDPTHGADGCDNTPGVSGCWYS
jgi:hypothetical protein